MAEGCTCNILNICICLFLITTGECKPVSQHRSAVYKETQQYMFGLKVLLFALYKLRGKLLREQRSQNSQNFCEMFTWSWRTAHQH